MQDSHKTCLLLNADYTPLSLISWKRAMVWFIKYETNPIYGIDIIDFYKDDFISGVNKKHPIPAVARTKRFFKRPSSRVIFCKKNIFLRDSYTCQYCSRVLESNQLTYDHVIPKSKWDHNSGSPTNWNNIVTCCVLCNRKKGNKTPKEANMELKNLPIEPNKITRYLPVSHLIRKINTDMPQEWMPYLPASYYT